MKSRHVARCASALMVGACFTEEIDPRPTFDAAPLQVLIDLDPAPDVVHVSLVAREADVTFIEGTTTRVWAYTDAAAPEAAASVPGPLLQARRGDLVVVDLENALPEAATTIHWHGIRLDSAMDGAGNHHGDEIFSGESFQYRFIARDTGTFWYHPHVRSDEQVERGLFGAIVVRESSAELEHTERVLVLDDMDLAASGELDIDASDDDVMMGRHGKTILVNGRIEPEFTAGAGDIERWRIVNTANGRYFDLQAGEHSMRVVESDGGALPEPIVSARLRIAPGERFTVDVDLGGNVGELLEVTTAPVDAGHGALDEVDRLVFSLRLDDRDARAPPTLEPVSFEPLVARGAGVGRELILQETFSPELGQGYSINGESWPFNTPLDGVQGEGEIWRLVNDSDGAHPFHLHGMFFQVLQDGESRRDLGWKDTVDVPARGTLDLAVSLATGKWMFHCQILEHAERGMMGEIHVVP